MTEEMLVLWRITNELLGRAIAAYEQRNELDARRLEFEMRRDVRIAASAERREKEAKVVGSKRKMSNKAVVALAASRRKGLD